MKTIQYLLCTLIATFVFAGCSDDINYTPGEQGDPNTYGVYFPPQEDAGDQELDPAAATTLSFKAMRTNTNDAITVPVVVKSAEDGIFQVSEIQFKDGQSETEFKVDFPNTEIGKTYKCSIEVTDKKYAELYGEKASGLDFSVTRVKWNKVTGEDGSTMGKWRDDFFTAMMGTNIKENGVLNAEKDVVIEERDDMKGYYRIFNIYDDDYMRKIVGVNYSNVPSLKSYTIIDARNPEKVWFPTQSTGWAIQDIGYDDNGGFIIVSMCVENGLSKSVYGTLKDGVLTFPEKAIAVTLPTIWADGSFYKYNSDMTRLIFPGAKVYDYAVSFTKKAPANGKVELGVKLGADVAKVKYAFFEGRLSAAVAAAKSTDMDAGLVETTEITKSGTIIAQMEKTGIYTIVGNAYNADGVLQKNSSLDFGYVAAGENKPVVMSVRTELTWEKEAEGHTPENSIKGIIFGEEIVSGYMGLVTTASIQGKTDAELISSMQDPKNAFTEKELEAINGKGYTPFYMNLAKGTSYTLLIYVNNGYYNKLFAVEQTTKGAASPLNDIYTIDDYAGPVGKAELFKSWQYWAAIYDETTTRVQLKGSVTISENTVKDTPEFDAINVKGLTAGLSSEDTVVWEYDPQNGAIFVTKGQGLGKFQDYFLKYRISDIDGMGADTLDDMLIAISVGEGYMAFVCGPAFIADYKFNSFVINAFEDEGLTQNLGWLTWFYDLMLVDPAVAEASAAPQAQAVAGRLRTQMKDAWTVPSNLVELRGKERLTAFLKENVGKPIYKGKRLIETEVSNSSVANAKVSFQEGFVPQTANGQQAGGFAKMPVMKMVK